MRTASTPWSCSISLRRENDASGNPLSSGPQDVPFGDALDDPYEVEARLRRAQVAILNPSISNMSTFLDMSDEDVAQAREHKPAGSKEQLAFSREAIVLDVTGPTLTDVSLVDLPVRRNILLLLVFLPMCSNWLSV
jgi:hypothetical protein